MAEKHIKTYPNGATLIYYQQNVNSSTDVTIGFLGGAHLDDMKPGLAHALEHSFFLGTDELKKEEIYKIFQQTGTKYNAFTSQDCIADEFNCPSSSFEKILKINSDMLYNRNVNPKELEREKKVILQELYMTLDREFPDVFDNINISENHLRGQDILGNYKTLSTITVEDIAKYKELFFTTNNMIISVVSDLPYDVVREQVEKHLINRFPTNDETAVKLEGDKYNFENKQLLVNIPGKNSFSLNFMFQGLKDAERNELYTYFEDWYFNGFAGKLLEKLRLKNPLVYTAGFSNAKLPNLNIKQFGVLTSPENVNVSIAQVAGMFRNMILKGISEQEFEDFQKTMIAERERKSNIKMHKSVNLFYNYIYGEKPFVKNFYEKLMSLTREDINDYMRKIYGTGELIVECIGDVRRAQNMISIKQFAGHNVFSKEMTNLLVMVLNSQIKPIYRIEEILDAFSLKYNRYNPQAWEKEDDGKVKFIFENDPNKKDEEKDDYQDDYEGEYDEGDYDDGIDDDFYAKLLMDYKNNNVYDVTNLLKSDALKKNQDFSKIALKNEIKNENKDDLVQEFTFKK